MTQLTIEAMRKALLAGETTAQALTEASLQRIAETDDRVNAYITVCGEEALAQAKASDAKGYREDSPILQGIPLAIKDNIITENIRTTAGSLMLSDFTPVYQSTVMAKLGEQGAITVGKVNMDEFAMGGSNETSYFKPVHNPWDLSKVPGGSSGGSAAAVAAGTVPGALGSDTGGSIRQPAAFTGLVGMKPTYGRVSRYGLIAFASSLDQIGPFTQTVTDNALLLQAISGYDSNDSTSANRQDTNFTSDFALGVKGLKIGVPREYFAEGVDPEIQAAVRQAMAVYRDLGAIVEEVSLPHSALGIAAYYIIASSEASSNLQRFDGVRYGYRASGVEALEDLYVRSRSEGFGMEVKRRIMLGTFSLSTGYYDAYFKKASQVRTLIKNDYLNVFKQYDVILGPTTTTPAFNIGEREDDPLAMYMADLLTIPANLAGVPALSLQAGLTAAGLPIGLQLQGKHFDEKTLYRVGYAFEQATGHYLKHATL